MNSLYIFYRWRSMTIYWLIEAHNNFDPAHTQRSIECTNDWDALWTTHTHIHTGIYQTTANNNLTKTDNNTLFNSTVCAVRTIIFDHIYLFNAWNCIFTMWIFIIYFYYSVIWNNNYIVCKILCTFCLECWMKSAVKWLVQCLLLICRKTTRKEAWNDVIFDGFSSL